MLFRSPRRQHHRDARCALDTRHRCFAFALLLAVAGTYGLMSRSIGLRTREIGVRRALGASDAMATRMLLRQGARQLGVGTLVAAPILAAAESVARARFLKPTARLRSGRA